MALQADIAVIGTGPGGYVAALRAAQLGASVVCLEKRWVGGVCLNEGCIPTKALVRSAEVYGLAKHAATFGIEVGEVRFDWGKMQARRAQIVKQMVGGVRVLLERAGIPVVMGEASFRTPNILQVQREDGIETVTARDVIIASGSRTLQVPIPGMDHPAVIDYSGALALDTLPESICIIGGGAIGVEFAFLLNALGVHTTLVEMLPRLLPAMDASIGEGLEWSLTNQGIEILTGARVTRVTWEGDCPTVNIQHQGEERRLAVARVMTAIGRAPNVEGLGLDLLGIKPGRTGIAVDRHMRTAVPHVYAVGDVAADGAMLAHVASHQGVVAAEDALGRPAAMDYRAVPSCVFVQPEVASVGLTEEQARQLKYDVRTGIFALPNNGRAVAYGETDGFVKMVSEAQHGAILGLHVVGPHASDLVLEGTLAINLETTVEEFERTIHPHPTLGEALAEAALATQGRALHLPKPRQG